MIYVVFSTWRVKYSRKLQLFRSKWFEFRVILTECDSVDNFNHFEPHDIIEYLYDNHRTLKSLHLDLRNWSYITRDLSRPLGYMPVLGD